MPVNKRPTTRRPLCHRYRTPMNRAIKSGVPPLHKPFDLLAVLPKYAGASWATVKAIGQWTFPVQPRWPRGVSPFQIGMVKVHSKP